jgi:hypothetical protein
MQRADNSEYISGGYFIVKPIGRPEGPFSLLPQTLITLSTCLAAIAPDAWTMAWGNNTREEAAEHVAKFGIPAHLAPEMVDWVKAETPVGHYPSAFLSLQKASEFVRRFVIGNGVEIVGIGLHKSLLPSFYGQLEKDANRGYGLLERVELKESLADGGTVLGYEPLGFETTHFHTWLCHYMPDEAKKLFGVRPNENGLVADLQDAIQVTEHMVRTGAEEAIWEPWLLVKYAVER